MTIFVFARRNSDSSFLSSGVEATHGAHQVAQKYRTTGFPRCSDSRKDLPSSSETEKSEAVSPTLRGAFVQSTFCEIKRRARGSARLNSCTWAALILAP